MLLEQQRVSERYHCDRHLSTCPRVYRQRGIVHASGGIATLEAVAMLSLDTSKHMLPLLKHCKLHKQTVILLLWRILQLCSTRRKFFVLFSPNE